EHFDTDRRGARGERGAQFGEVELPLAGQASVMKGRVEQIGLGRERTVVELYAEYVFGRHRGQRLEGASAAHEVPRVDEEAAIGSGAPPHDLPRGGDVGDLRPRQELDVDGETVLAGAITQPRERLGRIVDVPRSAEEFDGVQRSRTDRVGDGEQVALAER